jgi:diketogulonate reductase-like aldo/keto reductase
MGRQEMSDATRREVCTGLVGALAFGALARLHAVASIGERAMIRRPVPSAPGATVPVIGMGTSDTFDVDASDAARAPLVDVLSAFYGAGASVIDTSPMYGRAETVLGDLMRAAGARERTFLATKVWTKGRAAGLAQIEQSMRLLGTDRLDLLQIHNLLDWRAHVATLEDLVARGRVRYTGITHYTVSSQADLEDVLRERKFDFVQCNYSIFTRAAERRLLPYCQDHGVGVLVNRPFEDGAIFAKVRDRPLPGWAAAIDCSSWAQVFLKYVIAHPAVTCVIPATARPQHMRDDLEAGFGRLPDAALRERMVADVAAL